MKGSEGAVAVLIDLTLAFKEALDKKKRENNIIDFSDMEHLALSILVKKRMGRKRLMNRAGRRWITETILRRS